MCRFCKCFGRDFNDGERKCKRTTRNKHWNGVFRSDNIRGHMVKQHPIKFAEYTALTKKLGTTSANLREFFKQVTVDAFLGKRSTIIGSKCVFTVNKAIVKVIVQEFMLTTVYGKDDNDNDGKGTLTGDQGMNIFLPQYVVADDGTKVVSCYFVTIHNRLQYNYIVALISSGYLFPQILRVVQENRD